METVAPPKKRKKFYQADFLKRPALQIASLLFLAFQVVRLIRLFSDAIQYKKINQVTPEGFTLPAVAGALILIGLTAWLFLILLRQRRGISVLRRGNRFLLLDLLLSVYGLIRAIQQLVRFFQNFELLFLIDVLAIAGGLIAPAVILFLADRQRIPPGDVLLLIVGAGTMGLSLLGFIMLAISIGKDYTVAHALPELAFRAALLLAGLATLRTALKLHAELPIDMPLPKAKPEKPKPEKKKRELHLKLFDNLPGYDDEEPELALFDEEPEEDYDEPLAEEDFAEDGEPAYEPEPAAARAPVDDDGRTACLNCGRRFPAYLGVCPYCGTGLDGSPPPRRAKPAPEPVPAPARAPRPRTDADDGRITCPDCGKRFPSYLGVCPRCGRDM